MDFWNVLMFGVGALGGLTAGWMAGSCRGQKAQEEWRKNLNWRHGLRERVLIQKMREAAVGLRHLSCSYKEDMSRSLEKINREAAASALQAAGERICDSCGRCRSSELAIQKDAYYLQYLSDSYRKNGEIRREDMPQLFAETCCASGAYMVALNRELERSQGETDWKIHFLESRNIAGQSLQEMEAILHRLAESMEKPADRSDLWEEDLKKACRRMKAKYLRSLAWEDSRGIVTLYLQLQMGRKRCFPARELLQWINRRTGKQFRMSPGSPSMIRGDKCLLEMTELPAYEYSVGLAGAAAEHSDVSGDAVSVREMSGGRLMVCLSDGQGTGPRALRESEQVVELCEPLMESQISLESTARLIGGARILQSSGCRPVTLDLHVADLHTGILRSLKRGTPPTFLVEAGKVTRLESGDTPLGWGENQKDTIGEVRLGTEMTAVFLTDGVLEAFPGEKKEEFLEAILLKMNPLSPEQLASEILKLAQSSGGAADDMTVLAVAFRRKGTSLRSH